MVFRVEGLELVGNERDIHIYMYVNIFFRDKP